MLKENPDIDRHTRWSEIKKKIDSDARYKAVDSSLQREDWFREHIKRLKEERKREKEGRSSRDERKEKKERERKERSTKSRRSEDKENNKEKEEPEEGEVSRHILWANFELNFIF